MLAFFYFYTGNSYTARKIVNQSNKKRKRDNLHAYGSQQQQDCLPDNEKYNEGNPEFQNPGIGTLDFDFGHLSYEDNGMRFDPNLIRDNAEDMSDENDSNFSNPNISMKIGSPPNEKNIDYMADVVKDDNRPERRKEDDDEDSTYSDKGDENVSTDENSIEENTSSEEDNSDDFNEDDVNTKMEAMKSSVKVTKIF